MNAVRVTVSPFSVRVRCALCNGRWRWDREDVTEHFAMAVHFADGHARRHARRDAERRRC